MVRSGRGFDGGQGQDFADFLRRELHAAADQVEPSADGLERIRGKIRSRPAHASQARGIRGAWLASLRLIRRLSNPARRGNSQRPGPQRPRDWREAMLRPAFAVGVAVFAVGVVLSVVPPARQAMVQVGDAIGSAFNITSSSNGPGATDGQGTISPVASPAQNVPSSSVSGVIAQRSLSACPSPSTHPSVTLTTTNVPSSTKATTTTSATPASGGSSSGSAVSGGPSGSASPSVNPAGTVSPSVSPGGSPPVTPTTSPGGSTHSASPGPSGSARKSAQATPSPSCTSPAPARSQDSTAVTKSSSKPTKSPSSSASAKSTVKATTSSSPSDTSNASSATGSASQAPDAGSSSSSASSDSVSASTSASSLSPGT